MKAPFIILVTAYIIQLGLIIHAANQRDEFKNALIEFKHARYVIDPVTGKSAFVIDKPAIPATVTP